MNIVTDLLVAIIPVPGLWGLHIPRRQKIALLGILTIGWFVCVVSIIRLHVLNVFHRNQDDATYHSAPTAYWSAIEANLAIVCASLPALKPLVVKIVPVFGKLSSNRERGSSTASANNHTSHRLESIGRCTSGDDKRKLTNESSASHAQSSKSRPSESEQHGRNIYVTKHIEQHVENNEEPRDSDQEVTAAEFLTRGDI